MKTQDLMMGGDADALDVVQMPADGAFVVLGQVCSACPVQFRAEKLAKQCTDSSALN